MTPAAEKIQAALIAYDAETQATIADLRDETYKLSATIGTLSGTIVTLEKKLADISKPVEIDGDKPKPPSPRRKIVLPKDFAGWDSKDIQEDNVEIEMGDGAVLMKKQQRGGQRLYLSNSTIYGGRAIYDSATPGGLSVTLDRCIVPDQLKDPKGNFVRGVMTPAMRAAGWSLIKCAMSHYVLYAEAKDLRDAPYPILSDKIYGTLEVLNSQLGSCEWEHHLRSYGGIRVVCRDSALWNWSTRSGKAGNTPGGPSLRIHGTEAEFVNVQCGHAAKFGSEGEKYTQRLTLDNFAMTGWVQFVGKHNTTNSGSTLNGKPI
jgi:hypothetical protein